MGMDPIKNFTPANLLAIMASRSPEAGVSWPKRRAGIARKLTPDPLENRTKRTAMRLLD